MSCIINCVKGDYLGEYIEEHSRGCFLGNQEFGL